VLALTVERVVIEVDLTPALLVALPHGEAFGKADLSADRSADLERVER
jgi:hypothetical protein